MGRNRGKRDWRRGEGKETDVNRHRERDKK
jgi:hypothetical protein